LIFNPSEMRFPAPAGPGSRPLCRLGRAI